MEKENIYKIIFWRRSNQSIDKINFYLFTKENNNWSFFYNEEKKEINDDIINNLIEKLNNLNLESWENNYKAYLYENDIENYDIKYLLFIENKNHSYIGVKGLYPFKQRDYQKVIDVFENIKF